MIIDKSFFYIYLHFLLYRSILEELSLYLREINELIDGKALRLIKDNKLG